MGQVRGSVILAPLAVLPALCCAAGVSAGDPELDLGDAFSQGHFAFELRPRYNRIDESDKALLTEGGTFRAIAKWRSAPWNDVRLTVEGIYADHIGPKHFNDDGGNFAGSPYPLLPDPRYAGVNQVLVEYTNEDGARVKVGRQIVRMDNQRWVSDNDFRQIPQLFDGVTASYNGIANAEFSGGYFYRYRDTSGQTEDIKLTLLHAAWNPLPGHAFAAYAYFHNQPVTANFTGFADNSYKVYGVRAEGTLRQNCCVELPYVVEIAQQKPYANGDSRIDARYWRAGMGAAASAWTVRADYEVKASNGGRYGLQNPLTDFYAFNGWTLHFFTTPRQGLHDGWLTGRYAIGPVTLFGEAHRFKSDFGSLDFGKENDMGITWEALPNLVLRLQNARYDPGSGQVAPSIRKTWFTLIYTFG